MKYTEFDFKKVLAVLRQLEEDDTVNIEGRYLTVNHYEEKAPYMCFDALGNLFLENNFHDSGSFLLLYAQVFVGQDGNGAMLTFSMEQEQCTFSSCYEEWSDVNKKIFEEIFPLDDVTDQSWEKVLAIFIGKLKKIAEHNLVLEEPEHVS
jgi:hypothetical protein